MYEGLQRFDISGYVLMNAIAPLLIVISSVSDPYPWAGSGSGSTKGNVDLDPGTKKKS